MEMCRGEDIRKDGQRKEKKRSASKRRGDMMIV